ncbi:MAG: heme ABC transporter ATP-binding protein, partial [Chloroflexota bacterium]
RRFANRLRDAYSIAAPSVETEARLLSGGNLQRLILAREIASAPRLLVAVQPTRGRDGGAITTVHRLILEQREAGSATILISEDLDEVLALSDRVAVIYEGRIVGLLDAAEADVAEIGLLMTGGRRAGSSEPVDPTRLVP